jgi:catechol 2,3-dioxygenase-like lactoylglutathione lyase family enzyme
MCRIDVKHAFHGPSSGSAEAASHLPRLGLRVIILSSRLNSGVSLMVPTHGLSHIALSVKDPDRSVGFYGAVFGVREYFRDDATIQVLGPGPHDVIAFEKRPADAGARGGVIHFGFRLVRADDIDAAVAAVEEAGGTVISRGEFAPGLPYAFVKDPDGYEIEIWFE